MTTAAPPNVISAINGYLEASRADYSRCVDTVAHSEVISGVTATTRMHHLRFDANGKPMIEALAECLYQHVIAYCIAARNRSGPLTPQDHARLTKDARKYFVHPAPTPSDPDQTGEAGECLLYLLSEVVLNAPQVVAKMELKTNPNLEVNGSDGIHMMWNDADGLVDIYFGEAKLYQDVSAALDSAFESIEKFHRDELYKHEFKMVTKQFKYADPNVKDAVMAMLKDGVPTGEVRLNHACLIGYDWKHYDANPAVPLTAITADFQRRYSSDAPRLHALLQTRFNNFTRKHLRFDVFFIPFKSVQELRDAFNKALD